VCHVGVIGRDTITAPLRSTGIDNVVAVTGPVRTVDELAILAVEHAVAEYSFAVEEIISLAIFTVLHCGEEPGKTEAPLVKFLSHILHRTMRSCMECLHLRSEIGFGTLLIEDAESLLP